MNVWDIVIIAVIAAAVIFAVRSAVKRKGRCSCGCGGCSRKCEKERNVTLSEAQAEPKDPIRHT